MEFCCEKYTLFLLAALLREGEVWVESDAGHGYLDSSVFGPVPLDNIQVNTAYISFCLFLSFVPHSRGTEVPGQSCIRSCTTR